VSETVQKGLYVTPVGIEAPTFVTVFGRPEAFDKVADSSADLQEYQPVADGERAVDGPMAPAE
jgi:hypothetical protein